MRTLQSRSCNGGGKRVRYIYASYDEGSESAGRGAGDGRKMTSKSEKELVYVPGGNGAAPDAEQELLPALDDMTPREIVAELDQYVVGPNAAKRAVAVALRNRVRRQKLP